MASQLFHRTGKRVASFAGMSGLAQVVERVARDTIASILDPLRVESIHPHGARREETGG